MSTQDRGDVVAAPRASIPWWGRPRVLVAAAIVVVLVAALVGISSNRHKSGSAGNTLPVASASSAAPVLPSVAPTVIVPTGTAAPMLNVPVSLPSTGEPTNRPRFKRGESIQQLDIDTLLYVQGIAKRTGVPMPPLSYQVLKPGESVSCDHNRIPTYVSNAPNAPHMYAVTWCPDIGVLVINPGVDPSGVPDYLDRLMAAYADGLAAALQDLRSADMRAFYSACFHGSMVNQSVSDGQETIGNAGVRLRGFYQGSEYLRPAEDGFAFRSCNVG